jgi:hypothetical protein
VGISPDPADNIVEQAPDEETQAVATITSDDKSGALIDFAAFHLYRLTSCRGCAVGRS